MVFLLGGNTVDDFPVRSASLSLRPLAMSDYAAWAELRRESRDELTPFEPKWSENELSRTAFRIRVRIQQRELAEDLGYAYGIFLAPDRRLAGGVSLSSVRRGVTQSAELGYWMATRYSGKGLMSEAVGALTRHAFARLGLHRIEAATLPGNRPSIRVLERNGFRAEGLSRSYLQIDGVWRDHLRFGLIATDMSSAPIAGAPGEPAMRG